MQPLEFTQEIISSNLFENFTSKHVAILSLLYLLIMTTHGKITIQQFLPAFTMSLELSQKILLAFTHY
jgi:hypothetical protein